MTSPSAPHDPLDGLDLLSDADARGTGSTSNLPFRVVALLAVLIAAILVIALTEDRKLESQATERAAARYARELGLHAEAVALAIETTARVAATGARPGEAAHRLGTMRAEIDWIGVVDRQGQIARVDATEPVPPGILAAGLADGPPGYRILRTESAAGLWYASAATPERPRWVARVDPRRLLQRLAAPETDAQRLGLVLLDGEVPIADLQPEHARRATRNNAALAVSAPAPLPPTLRLRTVRRAELPGFASDALLLSIAGLGLAAAGALVVLMRSMRQQQRRDHALAAETALRRAMESSLATGLRVLDLGGTIRYVNPAYSRITGWPARELVGRRPPFPYWPAEQVGFHTEKLHQMLSGTIEPNGLEVVIERPDGTRFDAQMYMSSLVDPDGRQIGWLTSMADITESKRIRRALEAAQERFATALESLDDAVSVATPEGADDAGPALLLANRAYREAFGDQVDAHRRLSGRAGRDGSAVVLDPPSQRWYDVRERPITWVDGRPARLQIATDVTRRKLTEEIVAQQQQSVQLTARLITMGEMASSLAHELNQPLTAITNYSEGLLTRLQAGQLQPEDLQGVLQKTSAQAQRAGNIIRRIREFVKRSEPRLKPCAAQRIVEDAVGFAEIDTRKRGIRIDTEIEAGLPPLRVDPILIEQVLLNAIKNGADAMDGAEDRRIVVRVRRGPAGESQEPFAEVEVRDHGTGIPPDVEGRLFQPFFSTKAEGMGMGLNICRSIIEFHHGRFTIANVPPPGHGAVTRFTLPLAAGAEPVAAPAAAPPASRFPTPDEQPRP